ncbi:MAG: hypothetical protein IJP48_09960 [Synergistaceae bacterium]|nr:hypothetical protein [Synergistaceae bacterium]
MSACILILCTLIILMTSKGACAGEDYSREVAAEIRNFLFTDDWNFDFDEEKGIFKFGVNVSSKLKHVNYFVPVHRDSYTVYAISPIGADSDDKNAIREMAVFLSRANYGLRIGNFELDCNDGEIRFKVFTSCDGIALSREIVKASIVIPAMMFERYSPGILSVIFAGESAEEAIKKCEDD